MPFEVGDRVVLKPREELQFPHWKDQEVGVGVVTAFGPDWTNVTWEDGSVNSYRTNRDLISIPKGEKPMPFKVVTRTIPTKDQVLKAAASCPETKEALKILFPQDFEREFDWEDFFCSPHKHLEFKVGSRIVPSEALLDECKRLDMGILTPWYPSMTLGMMERFFNHLMKVYKKAASE